MKPLIVGIGGTLRSASSSEAALRAALTSAEEAGAETLCLSAAELNLPLYEPICSPRSPAQRALVDAFRRADGLIISSPGYHGGVSGLIKNALDYAEDTVHDDRVYISDIPVGCIAVAYGSQAAVSTLISLRTIVHALRGIPTPYGAAIVAGPRMFEDGRCVDSDACARLATVGRQVVDLACRLNWSARKLGWSWSARSDPRCRPKLELPECGATQGPIRTQAPRSPGTRPLRMPPDARRSSRLGPSPSSGAAIELQPTALSASRRAWRANPPNASRSPPTDAARGTDVMTSSLY